MTKNKSSEAVHSCHTYFAVHFEINMEKNAEYIRKGIECSPEDLGIFNKNEVERFIKEQFGVTPVWERHTFHIGHNERYDVDVNNMVRVTLKDLLGKEEKLCELRERFGVETVLEIVPYISVDSEMPTQILSLDRDIIEFLYKSGTEVDLDYYVF